MDAANGLRASGYLLRYAPNPTRKLETLGSVSALETSRSGSYENEPQPDHEMALSSRPLCPASRCQAGLLCTG
jgi:hypothetical protein